MDLDARTKRLAQLLEQRLDLRGAGFEAKVARVGRRLPRLLRKDAEALVEALKLAEHPKLVRRIDEAELTRAADRLEKHLLDVDPWERRWAIVIDWLAVNAVNLIVVALIVVVILALRGFL